MIFVMSFVANFLPWSAHMGEVVQFIPERDLERVRLIREARAIYERIFPQEDPTSCSPRVVSTTNRNREET
jgi:hypothetical protein